MLVHRSHAVRVAVRHQARVAVLRYDFLLRHGDVRQDGLRIDPRERGIALGTDRDKRHTRAREDAGEVATARAVHRVDQEAVPAPLDLPKIDEAFQCGNVGRREIHFLDPARLSSHRYRLPEVALDQLDDRRLA